MTARTPAELFECYSDLVRALGRESVDGHLRSGMHLEITPEQFEALQFVWGSRCVYDTRRGRRGVVGLRMTFNLFGQDLELFMTPGVTKGTPSAVCPCGITRTDCTYHS